jgi:Holliday junction resolvase RusA-like endonuclease
MEEELVITIYGDTQSKKNRYRYSPSGKPYKPDFVREAENQALSQIPWEMQGLRLKNPAVVFSAIVPKKSMAMDIDGAFTTVLDYLVKAKVIQDDNIRNFNGPKLIVPAEEGDHKAMTIKLYPSGKLPLAEVIKWAQRQ